VLFLWVSVISSPDLRTSVDDDGAAVAAAAGAVVRLIPDLALLLGDPLLGQPLLLGQLLPAGEVDAAVAVEVQLESGGQGGLVVRGAGVGLNGHLVVESGELVDQGPGLVLGEGGLEGVEDVVQRDALLRRGALVEGLQDEGAGSARLLRMKASGGHGQLIRWQLLLGIAIGAIRRGGQEALLLGVLELRAGGGRGRGLDLGRGRCRLLLRLVLRHDVWLSMVFNPIPRQIRHWPTYN